MKSISLTSILLVLLMLPLCVDAQELFVSINGSDLNSGAAQQPLATVGMALRKARELRRLHHSSIVNGIRIIVGQGVYRFGETLFIRPEDAGTASSPTIIEAAAGASPVFSGGTALRGWRKTSGSVSGLPQGSKGKLWEVDVPVSDFRQLWVNGVKAVRAKDRNGDSMSRIISWDHQAQTCRIPLGSKAGFAYSEGMEMVIHQWWAVAFLRISRAVIENNTAVLSFRQPESRVQSEHPWPAPWISSETGNSAFFLTNSIQFLDQPGEWYHDRKKQKLYYLPRENEDMNSAEVIAPLLETLVKIEGTRDHPVSHVYFKGISFQHTGWLRPSMEGHVPHQAGMPMVDAYKLAIPGTPDKAGLENQAWVSRPAAAIEARYTKKTRFEHCRFEHLASTGLDYQRANHDDVINGNLFRDIGGTAILAGVFSDESHEVHLPYDPSDEREVCNGIEISNNLVTDVTNEDWGCVGIGAGYVRNISIHHNDISEVSYTGISLGWGWTRTLNAMRNNRITANKVHHYGRHMYDVAAIYTLSAQPGTIISNNWIDSIYVAPYAHIPSHWFYLYTDEGTSYVTVKDNWCPAEKFLQNANGPGNLWSNNGPQVSDSIRNAAGLEPGYRHLLKERVIGPARPINTHSVAVTSSSTPKALVEIITPGEKIIKGKTAALLKQFGIQPDAVYSWKNHHVFFIDQADTLTLAQTIRQEIPEVSLKLYGKPFYEFNRGFCDSKTGAEDWDHILLTADLVDDRILQDEYMALHASQRENWPEITRGFCNADFQQLLLYRSGQQLMLIISIPRGKSLEVLNPKTTENNPKVTQWNELMKKYQKGIAGTAKNETWVLLRPDRATQKD